MKGIVSLMLVCIMMIAAAPTYAGEALQVWKCEMDDDTTEQEVMAMKQEWLMNARKIKGGERLEAYVYFPVAVDSIGETDFLFVVVAPTFEEHGKFWDNYINSPVGEETEKRHQVKFVCPNSSLWESIKINLK
jgi:hypothetical protein